ncbi:MAG: hypothetical protein ACE5D2_03745 [Fidelibacterota bacterium]
MITIHALLNDNHCGATAIFKDTLDLFTGYRSVAQIQSEAEQLKDRFPVMGVFRNFHRQIENLKTLGAVRERIAYFQTQLDQDFNRVVAKAADHIAPQSRLMTISHSSYVRETLLRCREKELTVYCLRSGPGNEGADLAERLKQGNIRAKVVEDEEMEAFVPKVELVVVGCDLLSHHFFINKRGTRALAEKALDQGKQVWVLADPLRFIPEIEFDVIPRLFEQVPLNSDYRIFW